MPLISFKQMLDAALKGKYAVGYFEAWNEDSIEAILAAGEETDSPIIIGFGSMTLNQEWFAEWGLECFSAIGKVAVAKSKVPVCFILNEVRTVEQCLRGIELGFNVVMLDSSDLSFEENIKITRELVRAAHAKNVAVEAELGHLPESGKDDEGVLTDPYEAEKFIRETKVDALAVSVGNVHLLTGDEAEIDLALLKNIREKTNVPLVIHGGSGFPSSLVKKCIELGVAKFNVGTIIKKEYYLAIKSSVEEQTGKIDAQKIVGSREKTDFTFEAKSRVKQKVKEMLALYGSDGKSKSGKLI